MPRSRRAESTLDTDISDLCNVERLLLSQAVYELGTEAWDRVSALLSQHPMIVSPKTFSAPERCKSIFLKLIQEVCIESAVSAPPKAAPLRKLAERHYVARITELRALIAAEEAKFKTLVSEIDDLRSSKGPEGATEPERPRKRRRRHSAIPQIDVKGEEDRVLEDAPDVGIEQPEVMAADPQVAADVLFQLAVAPPSLASSHSDAELQTTELETMLPENNQPDVRSIHHAETEATAPATSDEMVDGSQDGFTDEVADTASPIDQKNETSEGASVEETGHDTALNETVEDETAESGDTAWGNMSERTEDKNVGPEDDTMSESRGRKRSREDSEALEEDEAGPSSRPRRRQTISESQPISNKKFQNVITLLHSQISAHRFGNIFHNPIKKSEASDYHDIVKRPMDLKTIKSRIRDGLISNSMEFQRDIYLMFANAIMYNRPGSEIVGMAEEMMASSEIQINAFRQTEGFHRV